MDIAKLNQGKILKYLSDLFGERVCKSVYFDGVPTTLGTADAKEFMVISLPRASENRNTHGTIFVMAEVYFKAATTGIQNVTNGEILETKLMQVIEEENAKQHDFSKNPYMLRKSRFVTQKDRDEKNGYFIIRTSFNLLIN